MAGRRRTVDVARREPIEVRSIRVVVEHDEEADESYLDQEEFADRREAYRRGEFSFVGVRAEADVLVEGSEQTLRSPGTWGIESDDRRYIEEDVAGEEYRALREILKSIGVPTSQLPTAMDSKWIEWRT